MRSSLARSRKAVFNFVGAWYEKESDFFEMFDRATNEKHRALVYKNHAESKSDAYTSWRAPADADKTPVRIKFQPV